MDLKVKANGEWWHEGQLIKRQALIDLFSTVLWKERGKFFLKTPVEQIEIEVEDEPLFVNQVDQIEIDGKTYIAIHHNHSGYSDCGSESILFLCVNMKVNYVLMYTCVLESTP